MFEGIDPVQIITTVIAIIGIIATYVTSAKVKKYLGVIQAFLNIPKEVIRGSTDGIRSDEDYIAVGKATYALMDSINADESIPATYTK